MYIFITSSGYLLRYLTRVLSYTNSLIYYGHSTLRKSPPRRKRFNYFGRKKLMYFSKIRFPVLVPLICAVPPRVTSMGYGLIKLPSGFGSSAVVGKGRSEKIFAHFPRFEPSRSLIAQSLHPLTDNSRKRDVRKRIHSEINLNAPAARFKSNGRFHARRFIINSAPCFFLRNLPPVNDYFVGLMSSLAALADGVLIISWVHLG